MGLLMAYPPGGQPRLPPPNYAAYLINKQTLTMQDMESILRAIPQGQRVEFDKALVRRLYARHQSRQIDDTRAVEELAGLMAGRKLLVAGPGGKPAHPRGPGAGLHPAGASPGAGSELCRPQFQVEVCFVSSHKRLDIAGARLRELPGVRRVFTSNLAARATRTACWWTTTAI